MDYQRVYRLYEEVGNVKIENKDQSYDRNDFIVPIL